MTYDAKAFLEGLFAAADDPEGARPAWTPLAPRSGLDVDDLPGDWRVWFEERAATLEYDGGLSREWAEAEALAETIRLMEEEKSTR